MHSFLNTVKWLCAVIVVFQYFLFCCPEKSMAQGKVYCIGPRDVLTVTIFAGGEEHMKVDLTVSEKGRINVPYIGHVGAGGLSIPELEALITEPLGRDYFVNPGVSVHIKEYHSLQYFISGAVNLPGLYEMRSRATLMEIIAKAGGVLADRGNVAYILRESTGQLVEGKDIKDLLSGKEPIKVDLKRLLDRGDMTCNPILQSGDVIYIPLQKVLNLAESRVYVEGEVKRPGIFEYQPGLTALNACIMAGGFDKFAAPSRTRIIRKVDGKQVIIKIDLDQVKKGKKPDIELKSGDRIHVPETGL